MASALRAAVAAGVAWSLVLPLGGVADDYPYYAPFGAVVVVTSTVAGAARETWRMAAAIVLGALLAVATTPLPGVLQLMVVVGVGILVAGWKWLGGLTGMGSWVPVAALFVLIIGSGEPWHYAAAYVVLTTLGALVAVAINAAWPPLPIDATTSAVGRLRQAIVDQLRDIAAALTQPRLPTPREWQERQGRIDPELHRMREQLHTLREARRANWRDRRQPSYSDGADREARALDALAFLVEDIGAMLAYREHADLSEVALGPKLRPLTARVLDDLADLLDSFDGDGADPDRRREVEEALAVLTCAIGEQRHSTGDDHVTASGVVATVRRTLDTVA